MASKINPANIPKSIFLYEYSHKIKCLGAVKWFFSHSSGPGGQNVNKTNTKCELQVSWESIRRLTADDVFKSLQNGPLYRQNSAVIIIKSDAFRSQEQNKANCWEKLVEIVKIAAESLPKSTPEFKRAKIEVM